MRFFLLLFFLPVLLFGTKILNTDLQKEQNHVTLTLTFDTPYEGVISKGYQDDYLIVRMSNLTMEKSLVKDGISPLVESLTIQSQNGETMIIAEALKKVSLSALKSKDGYTVRIRFDRQTSAKTSPSVKTKASHFDTTDYFLMLLLAIGGAALMFWLLRKKDQLFPSAGDKKASAPSLDSKATHDENISNAQKIHLQQKKEVNIEVRFEETIDKENRAFLLVYNGREYPVVLGGENCFLNKHKPEDAPLSKEMFAALVDDYIRTTKEKKRNDTVENQKSCDRQEALESYKEKASRDTLF